MLKRNIVLLLLIGTAACQKPNFQPISQPWEPDFPIDRFESIIQNYEARDAIQNPSPGGIVLTGSSSFFRWTNAEKDLAPLPVINRGFGGSSFPEVIYYLDRIVLKYDPKTIVVYCENDQFGKKPKTPEQTRDAYVELTRRIREELPEVKMYYISMKPSPSRWDRRAEVQRANQLIRNFIKTDRRHEYIDVWPVMLKDGRPDGSIFVQDSLHMNAEGYRRWTTVLKPILEKDNR
jgi:lysophospholipase L1-like esterase